MAKKVVSKKTASRKAVLAVNAQKILKTGKLGAMKHFDSISEAAKKVAPDVKAKSAYANILFAAKGTDSKSVRKSAYGYKWSF